MWRDRGEFQRNELASNVYGWICKQWTSISYYWLVYLLNSREKIKMPRETKQTKKHRMVGEALNRAVVVRSFRIWNWDTFNAYEKPFEETSTSSSSVKDWVKSVFNFDFCPDTNSETRWIPIRLKRNILSFSTSIRHADRRIKCGPNYGYSSRNWSCDDRHWWSDDLIFSVFLPFQSSLITFSCQAPVVVQWRQRNLPLKVFARSEFFKNSFVVSLVVVVVSELAGSVTTQKRLDIWRFPLRKNRRVNGKREMKSTSAGILTEAQV